MSLTSSKLASFKAQTAATTAQRRFYVAQLQSLIDYCNEQTIGLSVHPFASEKFDRIFKQELGFKCQLTRFHFDTLVRLVADDTSDCITEDGHVCLTAIAQSEYGSLLTLIIRLYTMTFGVSAAVRLLYAHSQGKLHGDAKELANDFCLQLLDPTRGMNGRLAESVTQVVVRKRLMAPQLSTTIKNWVRSKAKSHFDSAGRGTSANLMAQVPLDISDRSASALLTSHQGNQDQLAGLDADFFSSLAVVSQNEMMLDRLTDALQELSPQQKEVLRLYFQMGNEGTLANGGNIRFRAQVQRLKDFTSENTHQLGLIADQIVAKLQQVFGVSIQQRHLQIKRIKSKAIRSRQQHHGINASHLGYKPRHYDTCIVRDDITLSPFISNDDVIALRQIAYLRKLPTIQIMEALK
jgi:hypothetical protein